MKRIVDKSSQLVECYSWWRTWFWLAVIVSTTGLFFNALFGRFTLFIIRTGYPAIAIPTGAVAEVATGVGLFLLIGLITELLRKIFRLPLSLHPGVQIGLGICLFQYAGRTLLEVACREEVYKGGEVPALGGCERWFLWVPFSIALLSVVGEAWRRRKTKIETIKRDSMRLAVVMMVLTAVYVITFNIWRRDPVIPIFPVAGGAVLLAVGGAFLIWISRKYKWGIANFGRMTAGAALGAVCILTVFYSC